MLRADEESRLCSRIDSIAAPAGTTAQTPIATAGDENQPGANRPPESITAMRSSSGSSSGSSSSPSASTGRPPLKLFDPAEAADAEVVASGVLSPRLTLSQFFEAWFLPIVLESQRQAAATTILRYRDALTWWERLTRNPPLAEIDDFSLAEFSKGLTSPKLGTYKRGRFGFPRPLRPYSILNIQRSIRAILRGVQEKRLVAEPPRLALYVPGESRPKRPFSLAECRAILAATADVPTWKTRQCRTPSHPAATEGYQRDCIGWWQAVLCVMFYLGVRSGTALQLDWSHLVDEEGTLYADIPAAIVEKTGKPLKRPLHARLIAALTRLAGQPLAALIGAGRTGCVLPFPHCYEHFSALHQRLQLAAGIAPLKTLSPQAWRRTHATQLGHVGAKHAARTAQRSLDHASESTTTGSYLDLDFYLLSLPDILPPPVDDRQKRLF